MLAGVYNEASLNTHESNIMTSFKSKILKSAGMFQLLMNTNQKSGKKNYTIKCRAWGGAGEAMRALFDPHSNRSLRGGNAWKFKSKAEAEQLFTMAILKWSDDDNFFND